MSTMYIIKRKDKKHLACPQSASVFGPNLSAHMSPKKVAKWRVDGRQAIDIFEYSDIQQCIVRCLCSFKLFWGIFPNQIIHGW